MNRWVLDARYRLKAYAYAPVTFVKRVLLGRDPYWRQYFWNRWGFVPIISAVRKKPLIWIDALAGGEVTQIVTLTRRLKEEVPCLTLVLSTNNKYSYDFAERKLPWVDILFDTPWDIPSAVRRALRRIQPDIVCFVQNVTAPILAREARRAGIPTVILSAFMQEPMTRHPSMVRPLALGCYSNLDFILPRSALDEAWFRDHGVPSERLLPGGNLKFDVDFAGLSVEQSDAYRVLFSLEEDEWVVLVGSLHEREDALLAQALAYLPAAVRDELRLLIAPRYATLVPTLEQHLASLGISTVRKTALDAGQASASRGVAVLVDTFGELAHLYGLADVVILGGSFFQKNPAGFGQNLIEPLMHHKPTLFGPFMNQWRDLTGRLLAVWPGLEVLTAEELAAGLLTLKERPEAAEALRAVCYELVEENRGCVEPHLSFLKELIKDINGNREKTH